MICCSVRKNLNVEGDFIFCCHGIEKLLTCRGVAIYIIMREEKEEKFTQKTMHIPIFSMIIPSRKLCLQLEQVRKCVLSVELSFKNSQVIFLLSPRACPL